MLLSEAGQATVTYKQIRTTARCTERTAVRAVAFGAALGMFKRETGKTHHFPGDCWNETNVYTWIGPPSEPIIRGRFAEFFTRAREGLTNVRPRRAENVRPVRTGRNQHPDRRETTPAVRSADERPTTRQGAAHRVVATMDKGVGTPARPLPGRRAFALPPTYPQPEGT